MSTIHPYQPVSCGFYDCIVEKITFKEVVKIIFLKQKNKVEIETVIEDVFTKKGIEYIKTKEQFIIRLDELVSVDLEKNDKIGCSIK